MQHIQLSDTEFILPSNFSLESVYPNPFNPSTTINFGLPVKSEINLSVYDINGRLVELIESGSLTAGYHSRVWNASSHSSGVYIVKITSSAGMTQAQKVVLIK